MKNLASRPGLRQVSVAILLGFLTAACANTESDIVAGAGDLGHIHDLVVDDTGTLLAATHAGLYRIEGADRAVLVGSGRHDFMSMTTSRGELLASGHPDLRQSDLLVEGGALTWTPVPRAPELIEIEWIESDHVIGVEASGQIWMTADPTGSWTKAGTGLADVETFHIDSTGTWWLTVHGGSIVRSDDAGASWIDVYTPPKP